MSALKPFSSLVVVSGFLGLLVSRVVGAINCTSFSACRLVDLVASAAPH